MKTFKDFNFDGQSALAEIVASAHYGSLHQAVASLAVFSHPETVAQTNGRALFPIIRSAAKRGTFENIGERRIMYDDNTCAKDVFLWANGLRRRGRDTQFNHVFAASDDPDAYTSLANICMTPAFVAKLTDTHAEIRRLLQYRTYALYRWTPASREPPPEPPDYSRLSWAEPLPPVSNLALRLVEAMAKKQKNRAVVAAREIGWLFSETAKA